MKREDLKSLIKSIIRESIDNEPEYVEYISQMRDEVPFMMGGKKFEYVWAKYPNGKKDIGVYAFAGDVVYGFKHFGKMYNINEATGIVKSPVRTSYHVDTYDLSRTSRDPDAEREDVYQVKKITSDVQGDEYDEVVVGEYDTREEAERACYAANLSIGRVGKVPAGAPKLEAATKSNNRYDGGVYLPPALRENDRETFTKRISGTVDVNGTEYDYSAAVTVNVVTTRQPHGEDHSEIDEEGAYIEIEEIVPEPDKTVATQVDEAIYDDVHGRNMWDVVNESDMVKENDVEMTKQPVASDTTTVKAAKDWILDCASSSEEEEDIKDWLATASETEVKKYVNRAFDGGWNGFLDTL
jgi:hypothetical protein